VGSCAAGHSRLGTDWGVLLSPWTQSQAGALAWGWCRWGEGKEEGEVRCPLTGPRKSGGHGHL